jgi:hypothetical protein
MIGHGSAHRPVPAGGSRTRTRRNLDLVGGVGVTDQAALNAFDITFDGRISAARR